MKVQINRTELADAMAVIGAVAAARTPKPILQCVLFRSKGDCVELEATDLEIAVRYTLAQVEVDETGAVLLPAEKLAAIVRESADEVLAFVADAGMCHIRGADSHFQIVTQDPAEFPAVGGMEGAADFQISASQIRRMSERTVFATARENTRYAINGVLWQVEGERLDLVATDGRRLAKASGKVKVAAKAKKQAIVPSKAMHLYQRMFSEDEEDVSVKIDSNRITLAGRRAMVTTALVEGQFPDFNAVIPTDNDKRAELKVDHLLSAVKRAALLTNEDSRGVRFAFLEDELALSSRAPQTGEARITIPVEYRGEPVDIGFNPTFFTDVLRIVHADAVSFDIKESNRPGLMRCGDDFLYVIMPVNLS
jgi:DNA polymerase-3 subunit beta